MALNRDLTGMTFNDLYVIKPAEPKVYSSGATKKAWLCRCKCGKEIVVTQNALISGTTKSCGCIVHESGISRRTDLTGNRYNRLVVECLDHIHVTPSGQRKLYWKCICDCRKIVIVSSGSLKNGYVQSCGCLKSESIAKRLRADLTGMLFGFLVAEKDTGKSDNGRHAIWLCRCTLCGNYKEVPSNLLIDGKTTSCGCLGSSSGELLIENLLKIVKYNYIREFSFDDLIGPNGGQLRFDFAILNNENTLVALIEYQGEQHYINKSGGFGTLQREITDPMKRDYCKKHNIPLYEITYNDNINNSLSKILKELRNNANLVPISA